MLYISRMIGRDKFGVVDTDDGVEEVIDYATLNEIVCWSKVTIRGVHVDGHPVKYIQAVEVYQPPETKGVLAVKTHLMKGIEVTTYGECITGVYWRQPALVSPVKIQLSKFGTRCSDFLFTQVGGTKRKGKVTLILDDRVHLSDQSFSFRDDTEINLGYIGVVVDMRGISEMRFAERAYRILYHDGPFPIGDIVIDYEDRKTRLLSLIGAK